MQRRLRVFKRGVLWLPEAMNALSFEQASDLIAKRVDDYIWAINKHGLETTTGVLTRLFEWQRAAVTVGTAGLAAAIGGGVPAALAGGVAVAAGVSAWFLERHVSSKEVMRGPGSEIAILVLAKNRFGS